MNTDGLRPIRGPIVPGFWESHWHWAIPAILAGCALLAVVFMLIRRKMGKAKTLTALEVFRIETAAIRLLLNRKEVDEVPSRLSRVLREYIEGSTGIRAPEQTTEEFLAQASKPDAGASDSDTPKNLLAETAVEELRPFLTITDEAKFARKALGSDECSELLRIAEKFVAANEERSRDR